MRGSMTEEIENDANVLTRRIWQVVKFSTPRDISLAAVNILAIGYFMGGGYMTDVLDEKFIEESVKQLKAQIALQRSVNKETP
jgi:hypothetical protein